MINKEYNICIAGKTILSIRAIEIVLKYFPICNITCLVNSTDEGFDTWQPSLKRYAQINNIKILNLEELYKIKNLIFISCEYDKIIDPDRFISKQLYNIHFSKLPSYKGFYTSALPLLNDDFESGVTLHKIDKGIDTGDIICQKIFSLEKIANAKELYNTYLRTSIELFNDNIKSIINFKFNSYPQDCLNSSYYSKKSINYSNLTIDIRKTASQIRNQLRAFYFPEYQVPKIYGIPVSSSTILNSKSTDKVGSIIHEDILTITLSTIDFDLHITKDLNSLVLDYSKNNKTTLLNAIINHCDTLNFRNFCGWSPLIIAAYNGCYETVRLLVSNGADLNYTNYKGTTPIMYALAYYDKTGDTKIFEYLRNNGADLQIKDYKGNDLAFYIKENNSKIFDDSIS